MNQALVLTFIILTKNNFSRNFDVTLSGDRTFGVLTKLDLMDKGTNALEVFYF